MVLHVIIKEKEGEIMRVIVSAGGTGGHIIPAIAMINKIKEMEPNSEFLYIGTHNRMEKDLIPEMGIPYEAITLYGLKRSLSVDNIKNVFYYFQALKRCRKIIRDFKPDVVIGAGGYVTTPVIYTAKKLGFKTFIHEQNSVVGLSNKYLSRYADKVGVSFESTMKEFDKEKVVLTGNPSSEKAVAAKKASKKEYHLSPSKKLVLIVMGSLGSATINEKMIHLLPKFEKKNYEVIYVTGNSYYKQVKDMKLPSNVQLLPFVYEMPSLMKITDVMVTRAGASTMSEIMALGIPSIFIPSPYVANNHQYKNASDLVNQKAGCLIEEKDLNEEKLLKQIDELLNDSKKYEEMKKNLLALSVKESSSKIYNVLRKLVDGNE